MTRYTQKFLSLHFSFHTASSYSDKYLQQVDDTSPPTISRSGQPIKYCPPTNYPLIGYDTPTVADVAAGKKCKITSTKRIAQKTQSPSGHALTIASAPDANAPTDVASSLSEGNRQLSFSFPVTMLYLTDHVISHSYRRHRRRGRLRDCFSNISNSLGISLVYSLLSDIYLIFVFSNQIQ